MNLFFLILALIIFLYLIKTVKSYKNKTWIITLILVICGLFDVILFLCALFLED